jgi:hypothetical protein
MMSERDEFDKEFDRMFKQSKAFAIIVGVLVIAFFLFVLGILGIAMMASRNERARWERWFDQVTERMDRQKKIITRLVGISTEAIAALEEIADDEAAEGYIGDRERAKQALTRIKTSAAAPALQEADSYEEETPVEDPRRRSGA